MAPTPSPWAVVATMRKVTRPRRRTKVFPRDSSISHRIPLTENMEADITMPADTNWVTLFSLWKE